MREVRLGDMMRLFHVHSHNGTFALFLHFIQTGKTN